MAQSSMRSRFLGDEMHFEILIQALFNERDQYFLNLALTILE
jgi:hypothetical protein